MMKWIVFTLVSVAVLAAYVRFAPSDTDRWHIDPRAAADPQARGVKHSFVLPYGPAMAHAQLEALARSEPRAHKLYADGDGQTWIFRSAFWGFPDYTTWHVAPEGEGTRVTILSRLRFGASDLGVNAARMESWLRALNP